MKLQNKVFYWSSFLVVLISSGYFWGLVACGGSSANLSGTEDEDTTTIDNVTHDGADEESSPVLQELEDGSYVLTCPDERSGDADVDFIVVSCEGLNGADSREYSCAAGIVEVRDEGSAEEPETLFEEVRITCGNTDGVGEVEEAELEVI